MDPRVFGNNIRKDFLICFLKPEDDNLLCCSFTVAIVARLCYFVTKCAGVSSAKLGGTAGCRTRPSVVMLFERHDTRFFIS